MAMGRWSLAGEVGWEATQHRGELGSRSSIPLPYIPPRPPSQAPRSWRVSPPSLPPLPPPSLLTSSLHVCEQALRGWRVSCFS